MPDNNTNQWDLQNLAHRATASFFNYKYGDSQSEILNDPEITNKQLTYWIKADSGSTDTRATICGSLCMAYVEAQGIPYHDPEKCDECLEKLITHLKDGDGLVLKTATIIDDYFKFINE